MQILERKNTHQIAGILVLLIAFFLVRASFLQNFSYISEDHSITTESTLIAIQFCRNALFLLGLLLFFSNLLQFATKKIVLKAKTILSHNKEKKVVMFGINFMIIGVILFLLLGIYMMFMFIDKIQFDH